MAKSKSNTLQGSTALIQQVIELVQTSRQFVVRQTNSVIVFTYFHIGRLIVQHEQKGSEKAEYGRATIKQLSKRLSTKFGDGFSERNIELMRSFFIAFQNRAKQLPIPQPLATESSLVSLSNPEKSGKLQKSQPLASKLVSDVFPLSWTHYVILCRTGNINERSFYEIESLKNNWGKRELQRQMDSGLFERLALSKNKKKVKELATRGQIIEKPEDVIKQPYILEFLGLDEKAAYTETDLETAIISKIEIFLLELGRGFLFQGRQVKFTFDEEHYFVDLVLYNRLLKCFVLVDLKIGKLRHQDVGQMQMYVNYYDRFVKEKNENPTIGIIICKDKSDAMIEITLPKDQKQIFTSRYKLYLPTKAELKKIIS